MTDTSQTAPRVEKVKLCPNCHQTKPPPHYRGGLCQACHVYHRTHGIPRPNLLYTKQPNPATCTNCHTNPAYRKGLCNRCNQYLIDNGVMRPPVAEDLREAELQRRRERAEAKTSLPCPVCGREIGSVGPRAIRGLCVSCFRTRARQRQRSIEAAFIRNQPSVASSKAGDAS